MKLINNLKWILKKIWTLNNKVLEHFFIKINKFVKLLQVNKIEDSMRGKLKYLR